MLLIAVLAIAAVKRATAAAWTDAKAGTHATTPSPHGQVHTADVDGFTGVIGTPSTVSAYCGSR